MITVIITGGSGTRLWPLSTHNNPKQLLKLIGEKSLLQETYARAKLISDEVYLVPETRLMDEIRTQQPDIDDEHFIVEPGLRGTANCIVVALDQISRRHGQDEPIAFIHADHHIRDNEGFKRSFETAAKISAARKEIVLVGIEPTYPAVGFGYIERGDELGDFPGMYKVNGFKEKPDYETAQRYMDSGQYYWNAGYFVGSVNIFLDEMRRYASNLEHNYNKLHEFEDVTSEGYANTYLAFENDVIDTALIEKAHSLSVVPANFDWMDVGSYKDLHAASELDVNGNHCRGNAVYTDNVQNSYIRNEDQKPVAVLGLDNVVVINTPDGVLVARKDLAKEVGTMAKEIQKTS